MPSDDGQILRNLRESPMTAADFRRIALSLEGVEEYSHAGLPIPGGWGKMGHTHIRLAAASEDVLTGALQTAWKLRMDKNAKTSRKKTVGAQRSTDKKRQKRRR